jgi:hypothetical protein
MPKRSSPILLIIVFVGAFLMLMLGFVFFGQGSPIDSPNQSDVQTPELNDWKDETSGHQVVVNNVLWVVLIAIITILFVAYGYRLLRRR